MRRYAGHVPERVLVTFADGSKELLPFPSEERWHRYLFERPAKVVSAQLDPEGAILLDLNKLDDGRTRESHGTAGTRWALEAAERRGARPLPAGDPVSARSPGEWSRAFRRGAEWRYLLLFVVAMLGPSAIAMAPVHGFLRSLFDESPRAEELVSRLDSSALAEVVRQLGEPAGAGIPASFFGVVLLTALLAPLLAGGAVALARKSAPVGLRSLLAEAAELYPRMLRTAIASCVPLGLAAGGAAALFHFADDHGARAVLESSATHASQLATFASVLLFWLANATIEAGRAHFAAEADRRSALVAWWSGVKLTVRHPRQVLGLCFVTTVAGVGIGALVTGVRMRVVQGGPASIGLAFLLGQIAVAALAWGRASKLVGLAQLIRTENKG